MKSKTANAYIQGLAVLKAAKAQAQAAKVSVIADMQKQVSDILDDLLPAYPELQFINRPSLVDTTYNNARKRPKPDTGALFFTLWVNPHWVKYELTKGEARAVCIAHNSEHDQIVKTIIDRIEEKGEWKFVEGSTFRYSDGPEHGASTNWAMIPV